MYSRALLEQTKCRWREFRREPSAMFWVVTMPILWITVLGFAFSNPQQEVYGVAASLDLLSPQYMKALDQDERVKLKRTSPEQIEILFRRGEVVLEVRESDTSEFVYISDPSNPASVRAKEYVDAVLQSTAGRVDPVAKIEQKRDVIGGRYVDFLTPGILALSIMTSSLFGVGMTIVSNRRENLLKRYIATPMPASTYVVSHIFGRLMVLFFEFLTIVVYAGFIFDFRVHGPFFDFVILSILGAGAFTGITLLCVSRTKSMPFTAGLLNLVSIPMMLLSGVFFSKTNFPDSMRAIIDFMPLTALADGLRKVALEGQSVWSGSLNFELAVLVGFLVVTTALSKSLFKWY